MTTKQMILDALKRLAGSMKAWTLVLGLLTVGAAHYGFTVDPVMFWVIVGGFATLLGVQGATDWGKNASVQSAMIHSQSMLNQSPFKTPTVKYLITRPSDNSVHLVFDNGDDHEISDVLAKAGYVKAQTAMSTIVKNPESGFAALWAMSAIVLLGVVAIVITAMMLSCTATQKTDVKTAETGLIACAKTEFQDQVVPVAAVLIAHPSDTDAQLDAIGKQAGQDALACAIKTVVAVLTAGTTHAAPSAAVVAGRNYIASHNYHFVGE